MAQANSNHTQARRRHYPPTRLALWVVLLALLAAGLYSYLSLRPRDAEAERLLAVILAPSTGSSDKDWFQFIATLDDDQRFRIIAAARNYRPLFATLESYDVGMRKLNYLLWQRPTLHRRLSTEIFGPAFAQAPKTLRERLWLLDINQAVMTSLARPYPKRWPPAWPIIGRSSAGGEPGQHLSFNNIPLIIGHSIPGFMLWPVIWPNIRILSPGCSCIGPA
jgi:hypothetical protein